MTIHGVATWSVPLEQDGEGLKDWDVILATIRATSDTLRRVCDA